MNNFVKTPEQVEIAEIFARLEKDFAMTKAEVGRELKIERGYVGMLIKGQRQPSQRTLEDFRKLEEQRRQAKQHGQAIEQKETELDDVISRIKLMERHDRPNFEVVKKIVESLPPTNSKASVAATKLLKKASPSVVKPDPK